MKRVLIAAALFASSGCARNAFLELTIELPPDADRRFAVTQVLADSTDFNIPWGGDTTVAPVQLDPTNPQTQKLSIEGNTDNESTELRVKVSFCKQPDCLGTGDDKAPAVGIRIERAFYIGKRTSFPWTIPCVPNGTTCAPPLPTPVSKCEVRGCRTGSAKLNCSGDKHFCED